MNLKRGSIAFVIILTLALATTAGAYVLKSARWPSNAANFKCHSSLSSAFCDSVKYGAGRWNGVSGSPFRWLYSSSSQNVVKLDTVDGQQRGRFAVCRYSYHPSNPSWLSKVEIVFDEKESWYTGSGIPSSSKIDVRSIAAHELGHGLGLGHTQDDDYCDVDEDDRSTMCAGQPFYYGDTWMRSLETDDKNGVKAQYPQTVAATPSSEIFESDVMPIDEKICDTNLVDIDFLTTNLTSRQRLQLSEVIVQGRIAEITPTRFNSDDNCTWDDWMLFYTVRLEDAEAIRDGGYKMERDLIVTILGKNPSDATDGEGPFMEIGDEIVAFLSKNEFAWDKSSPKDVFFAVASPESSFLRKASDDRFYAIDSEDESGGETLASLRTAIHKTPYDPE